MTSSEPTPSKSTAFAETMRDAPLLCRQTPIPATDSSTTSEAESPSSYDNDDSVYEIVDELSTSSDDEATPPPPRVKFLTEKRTQPRVSPSPKTTKGSHRSRSPRSAVPKPAPRRDRSCDRCADRKLSLHKKGCPRAGTYRTYVTCPRCQADITLKPRWRPHMRVCYKVWPEGLPRPKYRWQDLVKTHHEPCRPVVCSVCTAWQSGHDLMRDLHQVLCSASSAFIPALPPLHEIQGADDEALAFSKAFAEQVAHGFKLAPTLQTSRIGYLYRYVTKLLLSLPRDHNGDTPSPRTCTGDPVVLSVDKLPPIPRLPRAPSPPRPEFRTARARNPSTRRLRPHRSDDLPSRTDTVAPMRVTGGHLSQSAACPKGKLNYEARTRCVQPDTVIERGRSRVPVTVEMNERAVSNGLQPRWCAPAELPHPTAAIDAAPASPATSAAPTVTHEVTRDRFKIQRPDGRWTDSYGRATSPIAAAKQEFKKPSFNMVGVTEAKLMFHLPVMVQVSGHLPTGWGAFALPSNTATYDAYVLTPGHRTAPPARIHKMDYSVKFYFTDDRTAAAGTLYTDVALHEHSKLQYKAAGVTTVFTMKPLTTLRKEGEDGTRE